MNTELDLNLLEKELEVISLLYRNLPLQDVLAVLSETASQETYDLMSERAIARLNDRASLISEPSCTVTVRII